MDLQPINFEVVKLLQTCKNCAYYKDIGITLQEITGWCGKYKCFLGCWQDINGAKDLECFEPNKVKLLDTQEFIKKRLEQ